MEQLFDAFSMDFSNPAIQELVELLAAQFELRDEVRRLAKDAGVKTGWIHFERGAALLWPDVLQAARGQELHWKLIETIQRRNPSVGKRIDELLRQPKPVLAARADANSATVAKEWLGGPEAQTGDRGTLLDVSFLRKGLQAIDAVCKLTARSDSGATWWGSGFLIGSDLVLSNHHVLYSNSGARSAATWVEALFHYEIGREPVPVEALTGTVRGDSRYDWAAVRLVRPVSECEPLKLGSARPGVRGDPAFIIQHPGGGPKQVGLYRNEIRHIDNDVIHYLTDTASGSSGSPVCNDRWEVIALHHRWIWRDSLGPAGGEIRNQGVRIERVIDGLRANDIIE